MDAIFQRIVDNTFSELPGLKVNGIIPVPEQLLNEILAAALQGNKNIESCHMSIGGQNRVLLNLKTPFWPWPLKLKLKLFHEVDFSGSPKVRAFLENNVLLGQLGKMLKALPEGIVLYKDQVSVDIGSFVQTPDQKRFLALIRSMEISTEEGKLILDVNIQN